MPIALIAASLLSCGFAAPSLETTGSDGALQRQSLAQLKAAYTKYEYMIPMRDGAKLYTSVYVPKDKPGKHPILMERTPYGAGPYGPDSYRPHRGSAKFRDVGFIFAYEDVRGTGMSEGKFVNVTPEDHSGPGKTDESTDTYDAVDYLIHHVPDNNGKVGLWGISYPGFYAGAGGIDSHPALAAISPQAPVSNWFMGDDVHHNGAFFMQDTFNFFSFFGRVRQGPGKSGPGNPINKGTDGEYAFFLKEGALPNFDRDYFKGTIPFWNDVLNHSDYDQFWKDRALPDHVHNVHCAVLDVGGWFDAEDMWGALNLPKAIRRASPSTPVYQTMGPWFHGMWAGPSGQTFGDLDYGTPTSTYFQDNIEFPFFDKYLRDPSLPAPAPYNMFETGRNKWVAFQEWPPKGLGKEAVYLGPDGTLQLKRPTSDGADSYVYDPASPTPYLADISSRSRTREYMVDDQRWAHSRKDVETYTGPVEESDSTVAGPVDVDLYVTTTGTDADFVVKVIDVWPSDSTATGAATHKPMGDYEQEVRADIFRGKYRNSFSSPKPFVPGQPTEVHFKLNDMFHTFLKGHRMEVQIQSSWFPLVDRNPNTFEDIYKASDSDFKAATITILRSKRYPTHLTFGTYKE